MSYTWVKLRAATTVTHAVEYIIVNNRTNTTRTSTSYMKLPANVTMPPTNAAGTQVWPTWVSSPVGTAGSWSTFSTNITYPQSFTQVSEALSRKKKKKRTNITLAVSNRIYLVGRAPNHDGWRSVCLRVGTILLGRK